MRIYPVRVVTENGETTSRELKAESAERAEELASLKFAGARSISVGDSREQTAAEIEEEERLRSRPEVPKEAKTTQPKYANRIRLGILLMVIGLLGGALSYFIAPGDARPYYALVIATVVGAGFLLWGLTGASRARSSQRISKRSR